MRRSLSFLPTNGISMPTPKSKPSSTKKPVNRIPISTNQSTCKFKILLLCSVSDNQRLVLLIRAFDRGHDSLTCKLEEQRSINYGQNAVQEQEADQCQQDHRRADRGRNSI